MIGFRQLSFTTRALTFTLSTTLSRFSKKSSSHRFLFLVVQCRLALKHVNETHEFLSQNTELCLCSLNISSQSKIHFHHHISFFHPPLIIDYIQTFHHFSILITIFNIVIGSIKLFPVQNLKWMRLSIFLKIAVFFKKFRMTTVNSLYMQVSLFTAHLIGKYQTTIESSEKNLIVLLNLVVPFRIQVFPFL